MALVEPSVMLNSIMGKIYNILTNGDETVPRSEDHFFSWATPGIAMMPEDLEFLSRGLTGVVKKSALADLTGQPAGGDGGTPIEITPAMLDQLRAQDTAGLYMQAENLARLVDFVPDVAAATNNQFAALSIMNNEGSLSDRYELVLRMSQVAANELDEETKKRIERFRGLLTVTKKKKNLLDDTETEVTEASPLVVAYNEKMKAYEDAALEYNMRRIEALTAENAKAVHFWSMNASILRNRVRAAMSDWVNNGFKNEYEQISAFIDQVMRRDMSMLKQQYRDDLEKARMTGLASGSDFYFHSLVPGNFMNSPGWTEFTFSSSDFNSETNSKAGFRSSKTTAGGSYFGIFGGKGATTSGQGSSESKVRFDTSTFSMSFKITQVAIASPLKFAFLHGRSWRFDQSNPEVKGMMVSDGGKPPKGLIPAYPTMVIFIKDLSLKLAKSSGLKEELASWESSSLGGGAAFSFGPFFLGGSHNRKSGSRERSSKVHYDDETQTMTVPGSQIIGYKVHVLSDKRPDPLSSITNWI